MIHIVIYKSNQYLQKMSEEYKEAIFIKIDVDEQVSIRFYFWKLNYDRSGVVSLLSSGRTNSKIFFRVRFYIFLFS